MTRRRIRHERMFPQINAGMCEAGPTSSMPCTGRSEQLYSLRTLFLLSRLLELSVADDLGGGSLA